MAFDPVLVGTTANDGTGDPLRTAFTRVNSNFGLAVEGPATATSGRVAVYDGTTGKLLQDGTKAEADLVVGPATATSGRVAVYNGTTGKLLQDGAKLEADLVVGPASATDGAVALYDSTTGKLLKDGPVPGAASGLATLDASTRVFEPIGDSRNRALLAVDRRQIAAWDTFERPNQTGLGVSDSGHTWTVVSGSINISNNLAAVGSTAFPQIALLDGTLTTAPREIRLRSSIGQSGAANNWIIPYFIDTDNYVRAGWASSNTVQIVVRSAGVETVAATTTYPATSGGNKQNSWEDLRVSIHVAFSNTVISLRVPYVGVGCTFGISTHADWATKWEPNPVNGVRLTNSTLIRMGSFLVLNDIMTGATW